MMKRTLSMLLAVAMVISMLPVQAIALETETEPTEQILETEPVVEETETAEEETESAVEENVPETEPDAPPVEETTSETECSEPVVEETESAVETTEPTEEEKEPTEAETEPAEAATEPGGEEVPVLEEIETDAMLAAVSGTCGTSATWSYDSDTMTLTISGTGAITDYASFTDLPFEPYRAQITTVVIADGITSIGDKVFNGCDNLTSITIPGSVTSIGANAFAGCDSIASIELPVGVTTIKTLAFDSCQSLKSVTIPDGVTEIAVHAFRNCDALEEITIPGTVTHIEEKTFEDCANLVTVTIEEGVTSIGERAFDFCDALTNVSIPDSMEDIASYAFHYCTSLQSIVIPESVTSINSYVFSGCLSLASIELPDTLVSIGQAAFGDCGLVSIDIPESVTTIGARAFMSCSSLESITIPGGITSIEDETFMYCDSLGEIVFEGDAPAFSEDAFYGLGTIVRYDSANTTWTADVMQNYGGEIAWVPANQVMSGQCGEDLTWKINGNYFLVDITGTGAMYDYSPENPAPWQMYAESSYGITVGSGVTSIGSYAFAGMTMAEMAELPDSLVKIGEGAFYDCTNLRSVVIPAGVTEIDANVFGGSAGLTGITFLGDAPQLADGLFEGKTVTVKYPYGNTTWTEAAKSSFAGTLTWYLCNEEGVVIQGICGTSATWFFDPATATLTISGTGAMKDLTNRKERPAWYNWVDSIETVVIEEGITHIGIKSFSSSYNLQSVTLPDSLQTIGSSAFASCESLTEIQIPDSVTSIGNYAFNYCTSLYLEIPASVTSIGIGAVKDIYGFTVNSANEHYVSSYGLLLNKDKSVLYSYSYPDEYSGIPNTVTVIAEEAFSCHPNLSEITIPGNVETIERGAFASCQALENVIFQGTPSMIGEYAFDYCNKLTTITFKGNPPESISEYAFTDVTATAYYSAGNPNWTDAVKQNYGGTITWTASDAIPSGVCGDSLIWTFDEENYTLAISGTGAMYDYTAETPAPWSGYAEDIYNIVVESGVTSIGNYAFAGMIQASAPELPDTLTSIGEGAFSGCGYISKLTIPAAVTEIGKDAFAECTMLSNITFLGSLPTLADTLFSDDMTLIAYYPVDDVTWIDTAKKNYGGNVSWYGVDEDGNVSGTCGDDLTWLFTQSSARLTISGTGAMTDYSAENPAPWNGLSSVVRNLTIESGVTTIGSYAFAGMARLGNSSSGTRPGSSTSIVIILPASLTKIGENAFSGCTKLSKISFLGDLPVMADTIFSEDMTLTANYIDGNTTWTEEARKNYGGTVTWYRSNADGIAMEGSCGPTAEWHFNPDTATLTISGSGEMNDLGGKGSSSSAAPWNSWISNIESVVIEPGITRIGQRSFRNISSLKQVTIPENVEIIGSYAFSGCTNLQTVDLPAGLAEINSFAFAESGLTEITIPAGLEYLAHSVFSDCEQLESVVFAGTVLEICDEVFYGCASLNTIRFKGDAPEYVSEDAFYEVTATAYYPGSNSSWTADKMQQYGGAITWQVWEAPTSGTCGDDLYWEYDNWYETLTIYGTGTMKDYSATSPAPWSEFSEYLYEIVVESGATSIGNYAFAGLDYVGKLEISDTVTRIGEAAFAGFGGDLTDFTVPAGVTEIGKNAFSGCTGLISITFQADKPAMTAPLFSEDMTLAVCYPADNDTWAGIAETDFGGDVSWYESDENGNPVGTCGDGLIWTLSSNRLTISGSGAMADYSPDNPAPWHGLAGSIRRLTIDSGVTSIGSYAFADLSEIGMYFQGDISIPATVTKIGQSAFCGSVNLYRINFLGDLPVMADTLFSEGTVLTCYYPDGNATWTEDALKNYGGSVTWFRIDESGNDLEGVCGDSAQWHYDPETATLTITGSGEMCGGSWDTWNNKIEKVILEEGITGIGDGTFNSQQALKEAVLPDTLEYIGYSVFADCTSLATLNLPDGVTALDSYAFKNCTALNLVIPAAVSDIGICAVQDVKSFSVDAANETYASENGLLLNKAKTMLISYAVPKTTYTIPATVTTIGEAAFQYNTSLTEMTIPETVKTIETYAFAECPNLETVKLPQGITILEHRVFSGSGLTEITIPDSVEKIDIRVFEDCEKLEKVTFAGEPKVHTIDYCAFDGCTSLQTIELPASVTTLGDYAFAYTGLTKIRIPATLQTFGSSAFMCCYDLETVVFEGTLAELRNDVFSGCDNLSSIRFKGNAPTYIDSYAFDGMYYSTTVYYPGDNTTWTADVRQSFGGNPNWQIWESATRGTCGDGLNWQYDEWDGILTISGTGAMMDYEEGTAPWTDINIKSVVIEEGVTAIGSYAFTDTGLSQIPLSEGLVSIGEYALPRELTSLDIPASLTSVYFENLDRLEQFNVADGNTVYADEDGVLFSKDMTRLIRMPQRWATDWDDQSFIEYTVPNTVVELCEGAFEHCDFLKNIILPDSLQIIGDRAICCLGTGTVYGPETIIVPKNVTSVGTDALASAKLVVFTGDAPAMAEDVFSTCAKTAYYPADNETWTEDKLLDYGGDLTWIPYASEMPTSGTLSETIGWSFDADTATLTVSGTGVMSGYNYTYLNSDFITPWLHLVDQIRHVVVEEGITEIGNRIFKNHYRLETATLPSSLQVICDSAFYNNPALREVELKDGLITIEQGAFSGCSALETIRIPDTVTSIGSYAFFNCWSLTTVELPDTLEYINTCTFAGCSALTEIRIPASVLGIGACAFETCTALKKVVFSGDAPFIVTSAFGGVTAEVFYPADNASWTEDVLLPTYGGTLTWIPVSGVENRVVLNSRDLDDAASVWIDGREYAVTTVNGASYVDLPDGNAKTLVCYTYHVDDPADPHTQYPVSMKIWTLENADGFYVANRQTELDNLLQYEGSSIRVTDAQGIRMITSIDESDKAALTGTGLAGYTLKEYGTAIAWANQVSRNKPLVLGKSYVSSNYAYKQGVADPIFAYKNGRMQYTNVVVGYSMDQCSRDIAMRSYMILADADGNEITLYGGIVERSIGYIAYQNRGSFDPKTDAYEYVWNIIHSVYGNIYDNEYIS